MSTEHISEAGDAALARCISCSATDFAEQYWSRQPLLSRATDLSGSFTDLLDADAVDALISGHGLRTPFLRMAKDGDVLPAKRFTRAGGAGAMIADQAADDKVLAAMADGSTLVLQALHRTWPPLVRFGSALSDELGHPVQINSYVTPPQNQGFAAHYDVHDVFVLQVSGRKRWTIHAPVIEAPLAGQPWDRRKDAVAARTAEQPLLDVTLEPGDALYLPRGTIHSAQALGETSIHLTVGVHPITRRQLVEHLMGSLDDDADLRSSLPMGVDLTDPAVLSASLSNTVEALRRGLDHVDVSAVADKVRLDLMRRTRAEPVGPLAQLAAADTLQPDTLVRARAGLRAYTEERDTTLRIVLLDRGVHVPLAMADAVKAVLEGGVLRVDEFPSLSADDQLTLARRLVREGLLVPA